MTAGSVRIRLKPLAVEFEVPRGGSLVASLAAHGVEFPSGGMGECGGCGVRVLSVLLPATEADRNIFTPSNSPPDRVSPARRTPMLRSFLNAPSGTWRSSRITRWRPHPNRIRVSGCG